MRQHKAEKEIYFNSLQKNENGGCDLMSLQFEDNRVQVKERMNDAIIKFLHEAGGELKSQIQQNSRERTGQTKGSYD